MLRLHRQLQREYRQNLVVKDAKQRQVEAINAKVIEVQMMRFGQRVDIEDLDRAELDGAAEDLRSEIDELERWHIRELRKWEDQLVQVKMELADVVRENTAKLRELSDLQEKLQKLEQELQVSEVAVVRGFFFFCFCSLHSPVTHAAGMVRG